MLQLMQMVMISNDQGLFNLRRSWYFERQPVRPVTKLLRFIFRVVLFNPRGSSNEKTKTFPNCNQRMVGIATSRVHVSKEDNRRRATREKTDWLSVEIRYTYARGRESEGAPSRPEVSNCRLQAPSNAFPIYQAPSRRRMH